jgi:transcriptional regulator with XRE-family HTH domain
MNDTFCMLADQPSRPIQLILAANLRRLRIARRLSLSELARAMGISKATLSGVESGRSNPTIDTLAGLAGALRVSIGELLEELPVGEIRVVRAAGAHSEQRGGARRRELDTLAPGGELELAELELAPQQGYEPEPNRAGSRAHVFVLQGKLIAGPSERITELAPGDYASFPTDVPHLYETRRGPARALVLSLAPS